MGGDRWQRPRNLQRVRRLRRRESGGRRIARKRQPASVGQPPPRPQPRGRRTRLRPVLEPLAPSAAATEVALITLFTRPATVGLVDAIKADPAVGGTRRGRAWLRSPP